MGSQSPKTQSLRYLVFPRNHLSKELWDIQSPQMGGGTTHSNRVHDMWGVDPPNLTLFSKIQTGKPHYFQWSDSNAFTPALCVEGWGQANTHL